MRINRERRLPPVTLRQLRAELLRFGPELAESLRYALTRDDYLTGYRRGFDDGQKAGARRILNTIAPDPKIRAWGRWAQEYPRPRYELPDPPETPPAT